MTMPVVSSSMPCLPAGFRFHPTDEELVVHYLMNQAASIPCPVPIIAEVNIYRCNPWDLPAKALFGENEWYFFSPRDRKYPNGARPNRAAGSGYWKATGTDKAILAAGTSENLAVKKALVFYRGKPPKGVKTDWIMHEYRLTAGNRSTRRRGSSMRLDDWVLCRIHKKSNNFHQFSDQEQEGSTVEEDSSINNTMNNTPSAPSPKSEATDEQFNAMATSSRLTMTKSCSLTDLLNDYAALSQLLLDGGRASDAAAAAGEPLQQSPLIYPNPAPACQELYYNNNNFIINSNINMSSSSQVDATSSDYSASYNNHGMKRKRIMTAMGGVSSVDDASNLTKKPQLPNGSRNSYCNQQQLAETTTGSSFQYSSVLGHPFLSNQQLLLSNHLEMQ
ncbi:hypothetical protein ACP4OV_003628 [Aristida adscensionis]